MPKTKTKTGFLSTTPAYSMAMQPDGTAELVLYGEIVESRPVDWWSDEPIEGNFIALDEFLADIAELEGASSLLVRINSYGGDAGVSNTIHNRLREMARAGTALTCVVDGVAMSGGSLIMCACDTVQVNPSSLIMIHNGWTYLWGGYNADELREQARTMDAWDQMQAEIYMRKTGLSEDEIKGMMSETTYMTGREAVEKGFADEILEDAEPTDIAASADGRRLFCNGHTFHMAPGMFAPDFIPTADPGDDTPAANTNMPDDPGGQEGGIPMANTIDELRAEYPELTAQLEDAARAAVSDGSAQAERQRLQEIDAIAAQFDDETVNEAKYGENACTAQEMAYRAVQKAAAQGRKFMAQMMDDGDDSGTNGVEPSHLEPGVGDVDPVNGAETPEQRMADARQYVGSLFHKE